MKKIILLVFLVVLKINAQIPANENWLNLIEDKVKKYDKKTRLKMLSKDSINGIEIVTTWYKKKNDIHKIKNRLNVNYGYSIEYTYYFKNDLLIKNTTFSFVPLITKKEKEENDPCCIISEETLYFKNKEQVIRKYKKINLKTIDEYAERLRKISKLHPSIEIYNSKESKEEYKRVNNIVKGLIIYPL